MKASDILNRTAELVAGDREKQHGDKRQNFDNIAAFWSEYINRKYGVNIQLDCVDTGNLMELMKVARRLTGSFNLDDYIDGCGYGAIAGQLELEDAECLESMEDGKGSN